MLLIVIERNHRFVSNVAVKKKDSIRAKSNGGDKKRDSMARWIRAARKMVRTEIRLCAVAITVASLTTVMKTNYDLDI